ncbi:hypothetical protein [Nitrosomonas oligotropha]|uniref:Uncharacterized protein n=1 Tax=Nitrosomonas oligotropha TaxID=42354 RepID=A0A1H8PKJ4_9PROT|nr:hypothetical protein [Nitrosomonas oligotropha]SDX40422.1 hypothetical protein SAMN05216300_1346 [Nitrosomonas oligotropha]SEO42306.1 hypothetical protein SAMN05216333_109118 [Nitrosomonas oligotropha]
MENTGNQSIAITSRKVGLKKFFDCLYYEIIKHNLKIVMVRNFEFLPQQNIARDIDLIIRETDLDVWLLCLNKICTELSVHCKVKKISSYCINMIIEGVDDKNNDLQLDLNYRFNWRGIDFYSTEQLYQESIAYGSTYINVAGSGVRCFITLCHSYLYGGFLPRKYISVFRNLAGDLKELEKFNELSDHLLGKWARKNLWKRLYSENFYVPRWLANIHRIGIFVHGFYRKPRYTTMSLLESYKTPRIKVGL